MSKLKSPFVLGALASLGAISILAAPIGAPLMLGALGLVALGRNGVSGAIGEPLFNQESEVESDPESDPHLHSLERNSFNTKPWTDNPDSEHEVLSDYPSFIGEDEGGEEREESEGGENQVAVEYKQEELLQSEAYDKSSQNSRKLLTTTPTSAPTAPPAYLVNNSYSNALVANSFPAALAYVDGQVGIPAITFGSGAYGQTYNTFGNRLYVTHPITINVAGLSPAGFSIDGNNKNDGILATGSSTGLTFTSSSGNGNFEFKNFSLFANVGSGSMTTTVNTGATLTLSAGSLLENYGTTMTTTVNTGATLALSESGYFYNAGSGAGITTINSGGLLSMDTGAGFFGSNVVIAGGGTFASDIGGATFYGSSLSLLPSATHMAAIGSSSRSVQMATWTNYNGRDTEI
jgi:hypothetical protein